MFPATYEILGIVFVTLERRTFYFSLKHIKFYLQAVSTYLAQADCLGYG